MKSTYTLIALIFLMLTLSNCRSSQVVQKELIPARHSIADNVKDDVTYPIDAHDPWEGFNRSMYKFNYHFDKYVFLPIVKGYEFILPDFAEKGVSNFFNNLSEVKNFINSVLQLKGMKSVETTGRFVINTTVGLAGLFDVASSVGLHENEEDFGQTLGHYGVNSGPYLVLPILGPSSARDTTGLIVDTAIRTAIYEGIDPFEKATDKDEIEAAILGLNAIDKRHQESFRYYETGSPFEYEKIRLLYLKKRELEIAR